MKASDQNKISKNIGGVVSKKKNHTQVVVKDKKIKTKIFSKLFFSIRSFLKQILRKLLLSKLFYKSFKIIVGGFLLCVLFYGLYSYFHTYFINDVVVSKSEIVDRVSKLTVLPVGIPDAVVRVEDADELKKQNPFYENVKAGDYVIAYQNLLIIYDLRNNVIVATKKSENR